MPQPMQVEDAECRTFKPRTSPRVSRIERWNRVRRVRRTQNVRWTKRVVVAQEFARLSKKERGWFAHATGKWRTEPGADHAADPDVPAIGTAGEA